MQLVSMSRRVVSASIALLVLMTLPALAQDPKSFNERSVEKTQIPEDKAGIWVLDFNFKDPRVITVDIPGRGRKLVWYLWYQISNTTGSPQVFQPKFVWVTNDENSVHNDQILPKAQDMIQRLEDPTIPLLNSVTISKEPIPVSKEFDDKGQRIAYPKLVTGVAVWDDINPKSTNFSIYVYGLSDGWAVVDGPDGKPLLRRKTLKLNFKRLGDEFNQNSGQIRHVSHEWLYASYELPDVPRDKKPANGEEKPKEAPKTEPAKPAAPGRPAEKP